MALSPNSPDYIGEVRAVINDLRQNYLSKQQLFQQQQQAAAQSALGYAQLNAQRENASEQSRLQEMRMSNEKLALERQYQKDDMTFQRQKNADQLDLAKFDFLKEKENNLMQQEQNSAALENEFRNAYATNDAYKINLVMDKIGAANTTTAQRTALFGNVMAGIQSKKKLEELENNVKGAPIADSIASSLAVLDPAKFATPDQYKEAVETQSSQFSTLGITDDNVRNGFSRARDAALKRGDEYIQKPVGMMVFDFNRMGELGRLEPEYQKQFEDLKKDPAAFTPTALEGLAYKRNYANSLQSLKNMDSSNVALVTQLRQTNPDLAQKDLSGYLPDLTPVQGYDAAINPDTGLLNPSVAKRQEAFINDFRTGALIQGRAPTMFSSFPMPKPEVKGGEVAVPPIKSPSRFEAVEVPGQAVIPTVATAPKISPETITGVVLQFNKDPNALYQGRPVSEVVARLQSLGIPLPGLRIPQSGIVQPAQTR